MIRGTRRRLAIGARRRALATAGIAAGCGGRRQRQQHHHERGSDRDAGHQRSRRQEGRGPGAERRSSRAGTLTVAADATLRAERVHRRGRQHRDRDGRGPRQGHRPGDGTQGRRSRTSPSTASFPGLAANKYDLGMSSFTITKEREQTVDFVSYAIAGTSFYVNADGGPDIQSLADLCGEKRRRGARNHPGGGRDRAGQEVQGCRQAGGRRSGLPRPERGQPRAVERSRRRRHGGLAARRLRGRAVGRQVQAHRQAVRHGALRDRDAEGQRPGEARPGRAQGGDGRRHLRSDLLLLGSGQEGRRGCPCTITNPEINPTNVPAS